MVFYSHRLKVVLQHTVKELGLVLTLTESPGGVSIADNQAMMRETAQMMGLNVEFQATGQGMAAVFYGR
jgi:hypothetical protein